MFASLTTTALLSIENQVVGNKMHITIKSVNAGAYLCFNKKGRLVTRVSPLITIAIYSDYMYICVDNNFFVNYLLLSYV